MPKPTLSKQEFMGVIDNEGGWEYVACCYGFENLLGELDADRRTKDKLRQGFIDLKTAVKDLEGVTAGWSEREEDDDAAEADTAQ